MADAKKVRFGIFQKTLLIMGLVSAVPLATIWYINLNTTTERIAEHANQRLQQLGGALVSYVDGWVEMNYRMLSQNAALADMQSMDGARQDSILRSIGENYEWNYLAFTVDREGQNVARNDGKPLKYYGDRAYVKDVLGGRPTGQQVLIGKTSKKPALVLSVPIRGEAERPDGVLAIAMTIAELSGHITTAQVGRTGYAFLLDNEGKVIAHQSEEFTKVRKVLVGHPAFQALKFDGTNSVTFEDEYGVKQIAFARRTEQGWFMIVQQQYAEAFEAVREANRNALILLTITLVLVATAAYLLSSGLSRPIILLTTIAEQLSRGELEAKVGGTGRRDEIGALARAIERLGLSMRMAMNRLAGQA